MSLAKSIAQAIAKQQPEIDLHRGQEMVIDYVLRGSAVIRKGEDYKSIVDRSIPYDKLFAIALSKLNGVTVESIVREALESDLSTSDMQIKTQAVKAIAKFKGRAEKIVSGRTTVKAEVLEECEITVCPNC